MMMMKRKEQSLDKLFGKKDDALPTRGDTLKQFFVGGQPQQQKPDHPKNQEQPIIADEYFDSSLKLSSDEFRKLIGAIEFKYLKEFDKFKVKFNDARITHISLSQQISYVLGFENATDKIVNEEMAKYGCDLAGGFSTFAVYCRGLTENIVIGNQLSSLLRVVAVSGAGGKPGDIIEKKFIFTLFLISLKKNQCIFLILLSFS